MKPRKKKATFDEMVERNCQKRLEGIKKKEQKQAKKDAKKFEDFKKQLAEKEAKQEKPVKKGGRKPKNPLTPEEIEQRRIDRLFRKKNKVNFLISKRNRKKKGNERKKDLKAIQNKRQEINPDLFKCGLDFTDIFNTPEICIEYIEKYILNANQPFCRYCNEETKIYQYKKRKGVYKCAECQKQFRLTTGTIFQNSKVSLRSWFYLLLQEIISSNKLSLTEASKHIGVSKRSCHTLLNKIRSVAFSNHGLKFKPNTTVAIDTTAFFGKNVNRYDYKKYTKEEIYKLSTQVLVIKEEEGITKTVIVPDLTEKSMKDAIIANVPMGTKIYTDEHASFGWLNGYGYKHDTVNHSKGEHGRGKVSNNGAESINSILKIASITHRNRISKKYLQNFLNSVSFGVNVNAECMTLAEQFFLAIENIIYNRKPKKQFAALRMIHAKSEVLHEVVNMVQKFELSVA